MSSPLLTLAPRLLSRAGAYAWLGLTIAVAQPGCSDDDVNAPGSSGAGRAGTPNPGDDAGEGGALGGAGGEAGLESGGVGAAGGAGGDRDSGGTAGNGDGGAGESPGGAGEGGWEPEGGTGAASGDGGVSGRDSHAGASGRDGGNAGVGGAAGTSGTASGGFAGSGAANGGVAGALAGMSGAAGEGGGNAGGAGGGGSGAGNAGGGGGGPVCEFESAARQSALASVGFLRRVMDQYHERFGVYDDVGSPANHFHAIAMLPDGNRPVSMNGSFTGERHSGATSIRCELTNDPNAASEYGGFYFLNGVLPEGASAPGLNFGETPGAGLDLTGAVSLEFWAKGAEGGETVDFFTLGVGRHYVSGQPNSSYPDSAPRHPSYRNRFVLQNTWTRYSIDLTGADTHYVLGGFGWVASELENGGGIVFYLDDISFVLDADATTRRLNEPRLLKSFVTKPTQSDPEDSDDSDDFDTVLRNTAFTYDNALALLAFLADGTADSLRRARLIGDAFVYASLHDRRFSDGRLRNAYMAGDLALPPGWVPTGTPGTTAISGFYLESTSAYVEILQDSSDVGNNAWAMTALLGLYRATGEARYLTTAEALAAFMLSFRDDTGSFGGYRGGIDAPEGAATPRPWASTEHNLDVAAAFSLLAETTGDSTWLERARHAWSFVTAMWNDECFLTGTSDPFTRNENPDQLPLDPQTWSILARRSDWDMPGDPLTCIANHLLATDSGFSGVDFNADQDGVWFEGTGQYATALAPEHADAAAIVRATLQTAQATPPFGDALGLVAATRDHLTSGFGFDYFQRLHVGATAWNVFAQLGYNPYYQTSLCR
jgi:hypothetical protein